MSKARKSTTKTTVKKKQQPSAKAGKKLWFARFRKKNKAPIPRPTKKLTGSFRLFADSLSMIRQHWKVFIGLTLIYFLLSVFLVGLFSGEVNYTDLRDTFSEEWGQIATSLLLYGVLIDSAGSAQSESGAAYKTFVVILISLATVWSLRQILAGKKFKIKDAFYKGMYPLVPFILVLLFLCLLFIPAIVGAFIYGVVIETGLATKTWETVFWVALVLGLLIWSGYLLVTRIFAIYIVTLPDVKPMEAIRAARRVVYYRRWSVLRKLLFLPVAMVVIGAIIILPLIVFAPVVVQWVYLALYMFALVFSHAYLYSLYKELL